jgi:hypothetical protein
MNKVALSLILRLFCSSPSQFPLLGTPTLIPDPNAKVTECWSQREVWRVPSPVLHFTDSKSEMVFLLPSDLQRTSSGAMTPPSLLLPSLAPPLS